MMFLIMLVLLLASFTAATRRWFVSDCIVATEVVESMSSRVMTYDVAGQEDGSCTCYIPLQLCTWPSCRAFSADSSPVMHFTNV